MAGELHGPDLAVEEELVGRAHRTGVAEPGRTEPGGEFEVVIEGGRGGRVRRGGGGGGYGEVHGAGGGAVEETGNGRAAGAGGGADVGGGACAVHVVFEQESVDVGVGVRRVWFGILWVCGFAIVGGSLEVHYCVVSSVVVVSGVNFSSLVPRERERESEKEDRW